LLFRDSQKNALNGYSILLCRWLTELFGIEFRPALYERRDLLAGLESNGIDFADALTPSDKSRKIYVRMWVNEKSMQ